MIEQLAIVSGKGGTGKTTLCTALGKLFKNTIIADCDVDAANTALIFKTDLIKTYDYIGSRKAFIDYGKCTSCNLCIDKCRFGAIIEKNREPFINSISCEGCGLCASICPAEAISFSVEKAGEYYICREGNITLVHAQLYPGEDTSGKLIAQVRKTALELAQSEMYDMILIDGSPGIGCAAISSITAVNHVIIVTESTLSGLHDLRRIVSITEKLRRPFWVVINKFDLNSSITEQISKYCESMNIKILGCIPYDKTVVKAIQEENNILEYDCPARNSIVEIYETLKGEIL